MTRCLFLENVCRLNLVKNNSDHSSGGQVSGQVLSCVCVKVADLCQPEEINKHQLINRENM